MREAQEIILRPVITEKSMTGVQQKRYAFQVAKDANKIEIAKAVEKLFSVKVDKVNTMHVRGKAKRVGANAGFKPDWKKAIVTLKKDSKGIEFFDGIS